MEVLTYGDLESKADLLPLMEQSFGWPFIPEEFDGFVKKDSRLKDGAVGFCAVENKRVVGYVGVMDLATRTSNGKVENVGGIYGVATLPDHTRRGISTMLMNKAHEYFIGKRYRLSLLNTSPTLVAYAMYRKLGYTDASYFPSAYKLAKANRPKPRKLKVESSLNFSRMLKLFKEYVKDKTGFVIRDQAHLEALKKSEQLTAKQCLMSQRGYIVFKKEKNLVRIRELIATNSQEVSRLLSAVETEGRTLAFARAILDPQLRDIYRAHGFITLERGHGLMMAKPLTAEASFKETYGNRFFISSLDHF